MTEASPPSPVKLICGMIAAGPSLLDEALGPLAKAFGDVDIVSDVMDFDLTHYYDEEMGSPLFRRLVAFGPLASPACLAQAKCTTNAIEADFAARAAGTPPRPINLDVGYVTASRLVLASMKDFAHRIYLDRGVYAEVTLQYRHGHWTPLEWTFPDYASGRYDAFLTNVRDCLRRQLRQETDAC
ncbi:MAG: DUF4416 family protein [Planctomycetota bacterium]